MWDQKNGGFYWEVDVTGQRKLMPGKHLYGQAFGLYALSEYYLASGKPEALELANKLFDVMEANSHDKTYGGYLGWVNEDWTPGPPGKTYNGQPGHKLMNTHPQFLEGPVTHYHP